MNALDAYELNELESTTVFEEASQWTIDSLDIADWALRKIAVLKKKNDEIHQLAKREHDRIAEWEAKETKSNQESIAFFEQKLTEYLYELRKEDPKAKVKTPYGIVSTRKQPDLWEYSSDIINNLKALGLTDFIKVTEDLKKAEFKKVVQVLEDGRVVSPDGEIIESVKVIPQGEKVVVRGVKE